MNGARTSSCFPGKGDKALQWLVFLLFLIGLAFPGRAMEPPTKEEIARYKQDGSFDARLGRAKEIGNHQVRPDLVARASSRLVADPGDRQVNAPLPNWQGMPTKGTNEMLVFLIDFPDYPHNNSAASIEDKVFGDGVPSDYPYESLTEFYDRSSYGQLSLQGDVLGWYRMSHSRSWYTNVYGDGNTANLKIIEEVVDHYDATHDFSQYDNNGDGKIDYFAVIWSGPDTGWSDFWWGYQWSLYSGDLTRDGVRFYDFSWQWEARPVGGTFNPEVIIHETGHALGLPDYYDYDPNVGPDGGVGGLDMMDAGWGDHNAFSKFMLEWLTPVAVNSGTQTVSLRASAQYPDAVAIMPGYTGATAYNEYFLVENRHRVQNDSDRPSDGMLIWHVDATPSGRGDDFLYDNSYTEHKLLRLMEADGLEEIETGNGSADAGDYYNSGDSFTPSTSPGSSKYDGSQSTVSVTAFSANSPTMTAVFTVGTSIPVTIGRSPQAPVVWVKEGDNAAALTLNIWGISGSISYNISESSPFLSVDPASGTSSGVLNPHTVSFSIGTLAYGTYVVPIQVTAPEAVNSPLTIPVTVNVYGTNVPEAVDAPHLSWRAGGNADWIALASSGHGGGDCGRSADIENNMVSWVSVDVEGPGTLSCWWKVSSEYQYDQFLFYVDDQLQPGSLSGSVEWTPLSVWVGPGTHTMRWSYVKDFSLSGGEDAGWLDGVTWTPDTRDFDGDGALDWEENIAGTPATNDQYYPKLSSTSPDTGGNLVLEWPSVSGREYRLSRAPSLTDPFVPIGSPMPATPPLNVVTTAPSGTGSGFYRLMTSEADPRVVLIDEGFDSGSVPSGWTVVDYDGGGAVWSFGDPGGRSNRTGGEGGFATADSDAAGQVNMDTDLQMPVLDFSAYSQVTLEFRTDFKVFFTAANGQVPPLASVDFQINGGGWTNLWQRYAEYAPGPVVESIDISGLVAGKSGVKIAFYYSAYYDWWWQVDDVRVLAVP